MGEGGAQATGWQVEEWRGLAGLRAQHEPWRALLETAPVDPLGNDPHWAVAHAESFAADADLFGWTVRDTHGEPVAVLPFRREPKRGPLALRRAILAHDGTFDSEYLDLVVKPGCERAAVALCLDRLDAHRGVDCAVLTGLPDASPVLAPLRAELEARRWPRRERSLPACAASLPDSFDAYLAGLKSRMRSKVRSAIRRSREAEFEVVWADSTASILRNLEVLFRLHQKRWTAAGKAGSFADERRRDFYRKLAPGYLERGALAFAGLRGKGGSVACQFGVVLNDTYYQIQEGYDPDRAEQRVGIALRGLVIEHLIERGVRSYDFMAGIGRHKTDWGAVPRPCTTLAFALSGSRARVAYGLRAFADQRRTSAESPAK